MFSVKVDFDGLKKLGKEFLDLLKTSTLEQADNGYKCFALAYLGCTFATPGEEVQAKYLMQIISREYLKFELEHAENIDQNENS
jgi:hypothetical protein